MHTVGERRRAIPESEIRSRGRFLADACTALSEAAFDQMVVDSIDGGNVDELRRLRARWSSCASSIERCAVEGVGVVTVERCSSCSTARERAPRGCGKRVCARCVIRHRIRLRRALAGVIRSMRRPRFVTLTIQSRPSLRAALADLWSSWRRLREGRWWRARVTRALVVLEITHTEAGWHPHLHLVAEGKWLPWSRREAYYAAHPNERDRDGFTRSSWHSRFFGRTATPADGCEARRRQLKRELRRATARSRSWALSPEEEAIHDELSRLSSCCTSHQSGLVEEWERASRGRGERWGVSVKRADDRTAGELAKYLAKFLHPESATIELAQMMEFLSETFGARSLRAYGLRVAALCDEKAPVPPCAQCGGDAFAFVESRVALLPIDARAP